MLNYIRGLSSGGTGWRSRALGVDPGQTRITIVHDEMAQADHPIFMYMVMGTSLFVSSLLVTKIGDTWLLVTGRLLAYNFRRASMLLSRFVSILDV